MLQKTERLSVNKEDFPPPYRPVQLRCKEIRELATFYGVKKDISIIVQAPWCKGASFKQDLMTIQAKLKPNTYAGYIYTEGAVDDQQTHVECLIMGKHRIIKPIQWNTYEGAINIDNTKGAASTNLYQLAGETLIPQSDGSTCATLSLLYLKQLLKMEALQLKTLTFTFPYYTGGTLHYFFIPSPQVLRYSQSLAYNRYIEALVVQDHPFNFTHQKKSFSLLPISEILAHTKKTARQQNHHDIVAEVITLEETLPAFKEKWQQHYEIIHQQRTLMDKGSHNRGLAYASNRMQKIACVSKEKSTNPGLNLLTELEKKANHSEKKCLDHLARSIDRLTFIHTIELAYFLNKLGDLIDGRKSFPIFFQSARHLPLINAAENYKACLFFLNATQRRHLNAFFGQNKAFRRLHPSDDSPFKTLSWLHALNIPEEKKITFLKDKISKKTFVGPLLRFVVSFPSDHFQQYFETSETLSAFFKAYIDVTALLKHLPELLKHDFTNLKMLFPSEEVFYDFFEAHVSLSRALPSFKEHLYFAHSLKKYIECLRPSKRSAFVFFILRDPLSDISERLFRDEKHPRIFLELINTFCNEEDIESYLTINRLFLLEKILESKNIYPISSQKKLKKAVIHLAFFFPSNPMDCELYQAAFTNPQRGFEWRFLRDILALLPENTRWQFMEQIFGLRSHIAASFICIPEIHCLFPIKETISPKNVPHLDLKHAEKNLQTISIDATKETTVLHQRTIDRLTRYIQRIESYEKDRGQPDYASGFLFFSHSRAINREINCLLAHDLLKKLRAGDNLKAVFSELEQQREAIILKHRFMEQSFYKARGLKSAELMSIVRAVQKPVLDEKKAFHCIPLEPTHLKK